ncbi:MAG: hypothetical protein IJW36_00620 [Clostridia bacterium]|nr:hypothetical protein [Clostridia bacterium]
MFKSLIEKKFNGKELSQTEYYEAVDKLMLTGVNADSIKFFLSLNSFGMTAKEVLYFTKAIRDSGRVLKWDECVMEKHSTGGIGDSTSVVLVPLLASLGYKIIKTTTKSFMFTNGSADRFGAIPGFSVNLALDEIEKTLNKTNACVLSHDDNICPVDRIVQTLREECGVENDINLLAASIASKKLASGASVVLVDVKYGSASIVGNYQTAKNLAKLLQYIFDKCKVKSVIVLTDTAQTIGEGIGNAVEVVDALNVLQGKHCKLRDVSVEYATEMVMKANEDLNRKDVKDMVNAALDNGSAYNQLLRIIKAQGGDFKIVKEAKLFNPYKSVNFVSDREGYVGSINSLLLGELIRRLCADSHDSNIGAILRVKIGDYVKVGDIIVSFYYKDEADFDKYKNAIAGCVRLTNEVMKPVDIIKKVIR